jgi:hypothetical protein
VANTQAALDSAAKTVLLADQAAKAARDKKDARTKSIAETQAKLDAGATGDEEKALKAELASEKAKLSNDEMELSAAETALQNAQKAKLAIEQNFNAAIASAQATASGTAQLSDSGTRSTIDKDTIAQIAGTTKEIVLAITMKGHLTDTCINLMAQFANETDEAKRKNLQELNDQCRDVIKIYLETYARKGPQPPPNPPSLVEPQSPSASDIQGISRIDLPSIPRRKSAAKTQ